jgi:hypothetical protein
MLSNQTLICLILENQKLKAEIARLKLAIQLHNTFVKELETIIDDFDKLTVNPLIEDPADIYPN